MDTLGFDQVPARNTNTVLGDSYVLGRRIGRGAMGEVYEAQHVRLPGQFAVKVLLPELQGNQDAFARFCREAEIMSQLRHPNIVQIFDFNVAPDSRPYFVMEYLQGRDLEARLRTGPMSLPAVTRLVEAVASALALAHAHGVVHRDLKPANIFLATVDGQTDELVKVLDFGISKVRSAAGQISQAADVLGTPYYMSPEQARGQTNAVDGRTDQFALGAIAYRMLTGTEPFHGDDSASVLYQVVHEDPPPLSLFLPPEWDTERLQAVLDRALAKQPADRFGGMMELARAFEDAAERTIGHGASLHAQAAAARRLDDAEIDPPPPIRTPTPLRVSPPRRLPTATPVPLPTPRPAPPLTLTPKPAAARGPTPSTPPGPVIDWEVPIVADDLRIKRARGPVVALILLAVAATLGITGWYRKLPEIGAAARQRIHEWTRPPGTAGAPPTEPPAAPPTEPPAAPAPAAPPTPPAAPEANTAAPAEASPRPPAAAPEKPRAQRQRAGRNRREPAPQFAPPIARPDTIQITPPTNPPPEGGAFEIAPPAPLQPRPNDMGPRIETPAPTP
jgi:serine/threonine-protein kinase